MDIKLLHDFSFCIPAILFINILFHVPKKAAIVSTFIGSIGYVIYEYSTPILHSPIAGYFTATLIMAITCEICARLIKMPTTVFIIPSIIPLVPGLGLYQTMAFLVADDLANATQTGVTTIFAIVSMAMAMVLTTLFTATISTIIRQHKKPN